MNLQIKCAFLLSFLMLGILVLPRQARADCDTIFSECSAGVSKLFSECLQSDLGETAATCKNKFEPKSQACATKFNQCYAESQPASSEVPSSSPSPAAPTPSSIGNFGSIDSKLGNVSKGFYGDVAPKSLEQMIGGYIKTGLALVGVIFLLLMVYGGYTWMIARGDETEATKAKDTITMAAIGMAVVLIAYVITYFILSYALQSVG